MSFHENPHHLTSANNTSHPEKPFNLCKSGIVEAMSQFDAMGSSSEAARDIAAQVGQEALMASGETMADDSQAGHASLQSALDKIDATITQAQALKTDGPGATPPTNSDTGSSTTPPAEPHVTTGADPTPNPIHATPAHTREPSRKIGDPVKPVETEVPESNARRSTRFGRKLSAGAEDVKEYSEELINSIASKAGDGIDPQGPGVRTETHTAPTPQASSGTQGDDVSTPDVMGTLVMTGAFAIDATIRVVNRFRDNRRKRNQ